MILNQNATDHSAACIRSHVIFQYLILPSFPLNPPEKPSQLQWAFITMWTSVGASERNLSIHEKCRVSQTQPDRPFRETRCLAWLRTGPGYRATVVCSHRLQSCRYFLTTFLCHILQLYIWRKAWELWRDSIDKNSQWEDTRTITNVRSIPLFQFLFQFMSQGKS